MKKIDKATSTMMQNGLHQFYTNFADFKQKFLVREYLSEKDDDLQALTAEQLKRPMILMSCLFGVAIVIWMAEIIIFRWKNRRTHGQQPQRVALAICSAHF